MASCVCFGEAIEIPMLQSLEEFRAWARSDDFPTNARIDYIAGRIEVEMSPEGIIRHGVLKGELYRVLGNRVKRQGSGLLLVDRSRLCHDTAGLSVEPDVLFVSHESLNKGRARLVPMANDEEEFIEINGAADLVVEVVSTHSVRKDTVLLPATYYASGVTEFWMVDARGEELVFQIHRRGSEHFEPMACDQHGFQFSAVMKCAYRLERQRNQYGHWTYDLLEDEAT
jgi:Uma2 family endonuclease